MARLPIVVALITLTAITPAAAQSVAMIDDRPSLAWRAPEGCPDADSLRTRIEHRLERTLDGAVQGIEVDVVLAAGRYTARIDLRAMTVANDVRTLTSKHCEELADAVAVIVTRLASETIARVRGDMRDDPAARARARFIVEPPPKPKLRLWTVGMRVSGVSGIGIIPKVGLAAEVAVVARRDNLLAELAGTRWLDSYAQFHDGAPAVVDVLLDTASVRLGWRPKHLPLRAWAAFEYGFMAGNSVKLPSQQLEDGRWLAAGGGFAIAWQMTKWLRLVGTNETMLALDRVRFTMGDGLVVYAPSPMSFRASAGLEVGWQ
ncbi:MAG TPA: hypothetical protein VIV11_27810 [Kofleriaceae bacterium]